MRVSSKLLGLSRGECVFPMESSFPDLGTKALAWGVRWRWAEAKAKVFAWKVKAELPGGPGPNDLLTPLT